MGLQWSLGYGSRDAQRVAGKEAADINLIIIVRGQLVPTVSGHEVPLSPEIVVQASHGEVTRRGQTNVACETQLVCPVAFVLRAGRVRLGFVGLPYLLNQRVDADPTRVVGCPGPGVSCAIVGNGIRIQVINRASCGVGYESQLQGRRGNVPLNRLGVGEAETFVISKEISLAAENLFRDKRPADRPAEAAVMEAGQRSRAGIQNVLVVVLPTLRRPVVVFIVF